MMDKQTLTKLIKSAVLPGWYHGLRGWTVTGLPNRSEKVLRGIDGSIMATTWNFYLNFWLWIDDELLTPETLSLNKIEHHLDSDHLPILTFELHHKDILMRNTLTVIDGATNGIGLINVDVENLSPTRHKVVLGLVVRPFRVDEKLGTIYHLSYADRILSINDKFHIFAEGNPHFVITSLFEGTELSPKGDDKIPQLLSGALMYNLRMAPGAGKHIKFRFNIDPMDRRSATPLLHRLSIYLPIDKVRTYWRTLLYRTRWHIPAPLPDAIYASLAYILINMANNQLHPGPTFYDYFWYRDAAYIVAALLRYGYADFVKRTLPTFMEGQSPTGEFPPILDNKLRPVKPIKRLKEWDSQGQAIFAIAEYYRFTHDKKILETYYPHIQRGAEYILKQRARRLKERLRNTPYYGLLPPSWSAEDLGSDKWHHYWDDFWCVIGLRDAAFISKILGKQDSHRYETAASELLNSVFNSIQLLIKRKKIKWIPNGPEDLTSSSMARGTSPLLWPGMLVDTSNSLVRESFDYYFKKWIQPYGGAYYHQKHFWPYGLELATCYLILQQPQRAHMILDWYLQHQTVPGTYAWAEVIDDTGRRVAGDAPHAWVAADLLNLLRMMFVMERNDRIVIFAGVKDEWLDQPMVIENLPTYFGQIDAIIYDPATRSIKIRSSIPYERFELTRSDLKLVQ